MLNSDLACACLCLNDYTNFRVTQNSSSPMFLTFQKVADSIPLLCQWVIDQKQLFLHGSEAWSGSANTALSFTCMLRSVGKGKELLHWPGFSQLCVEVCGSADNCSQGSFCAKESQGPPLHPRGLHPWKQMSLARVL